MDLSSIGKVPVRLVRGRFDLRPVRTLVARLSSRSRSWPSREHMRVLAYAATSLAIGLAGYFWLDLRIGEAVACALALYTVGSLGHMTSRLTSVLQSIARRPAEETAIMASPQIEPAHSATLPEGISEALSVTPEAIGDDDGVAHSTETLAMLKAIATHSGGHLSPANEDRFETRHILDDGLSGVQFGVGRHSYVTNPIVTLPHRRTALVDGQIELLSHSGEPSGADAAEEATALALARLDFAYAVAYSRTAPGRIAAPQILTHLPAVSLSSPDFIEEMFMILDEDPSLRERLVFEIPLAALAIGKNPNETVINALCRRALSITVTIPDQKSIAALVNAHHSWNMLSHIRLQATSLIKQDPGVLSALHMLDISLIATDVRNDVEVAELLDLNVNYAQGPLFATGALSQPRKAGAETAKAKAGTGAKTPARRTSNRRRVAPANADADTLTPGKSTRTRTSATKPKNLMPKS